MKVLKVIKNTITIIILSLFIFSLTIFIYYSINKENLENYICSSFIKIESINSINEYTNKNSNSFKQNNKLLNTVKLLVKFKKEEEKIFKGIAPLFNSSGKNIILPKNKQLLIIDTGWHSLYISTSFLAIKSIYNENRNYKISDRKLSHKNKTMTLYKIQFKKIRKSIFLIINKNLVFISQDRKTISDSFKCLEGRYKNKMENSELMLSKNRTKKLFNSLHNTLFYNFKKDADYSIWSANKQKNGSFINGKIKINGLQKKLTKRYHRILDSNQYRFQSHLLIPAAFSEAFILLFDDLEEIYYIISKNKIPAKERILTKKSFRWTANELGLFRYKNSNYLFIRAADIKRLMKQISLIADLKDKKSAKMPGFIRNFKKAFHLRKDFSCYTRVEDCIIFAENVKSLDYLKKALTLQKIKKQEYSIQKRFIIKNKNNFIFVWKTKRPRLPIISKISKIIRINIGDLRGSIQGSFHNDYIEIDGMLK